MATQAPSSGDQDRRKVRRNSFIGLAFILVGIIAGGLVGVFYGENIWMASGGPEKKLQRLIDTVAQKKEFAEEQFSLAEALEGEAETASAEKAEHLREEADEKRAESKRLLGHIETIDEKILEMEGRVETAKQESETRGYSVARIIGQLTEFSGNIFIQVLKLLVIPLVVTSMICGITGLGDIRKLGSIGGRTVGYYMLTTAVAVSIGITLVQVIKPGREADDTFAFVEQRVMDKKGTSILDTMLDVVRGREKADGSGDRDSATGMFPSNIFEAASKTNVLALIVFCIVFGGALTTLGEKGRVAIDFFQAANGAVMKMVHLVMFFAPIGIFGLVAHSIADSGGGAGFKQQLIQQGQYVVTVLLGLGLHAVFLAFALMILARRNPITYTLNMLRALLTAMSTASSSATLPITMECVEENNQVSKRTSSFVLPLGATINMDGTALYEAIAVIFIAQSLGMDLSGGVLLVIFLTATLAAIGAAGIPSAGLVTMVIVLQAAGVPTTGIGTILAIDWFLDRMRTTLNVYGDSVGAGVIDRAMGEASS